MITLIIIIPMSIIVVLLASLCLLFSLLRPNNDALLGINYLIKIPIIICHTYVSDILRQSVCFISNNLKVAKM